MLSLSIFSKAEPYNKRRNREKISAGCAQIFPVMQALKVKISLKDVDFLESNFKLS